MSDLRPYAAFNATSVVLAIATGKSPANLDTIDLRDFIASVLARCWDMTVDGRPSMTWCCEALSHETTNFFNVYCEYEDDKLDDIPPEYKTKSEDWLAIRDPNSAKVYEFDFVPRIAEDWCVVRSLFSLEVRDPDSRPFYSGSM